MLSLILIGAIIFSLAIFVYSLVSHRIEGSIITAPMIFVGIGLLVSPEGFDIVAVDANSPLILIFAEIALVLILFSDAARIDFTTLKGNRSYPSRLLAIGLPLTIFAGAVTAIIFFTDIALPEAALIGAILAPTDAGLGQVIVNSPKVPARIRQALNVESGLNDGGAIPFFALFLVLADAEKDNIPAAQWVLFAAEQIGLGILVGLIVGLIGGYLVNKAIDRGMMRGRFQWTGFLALAIISFVAADAVGGSGFIAAFVGGFATTLTGKHVRRIDNRIYCNWWRNLQSCCIFYFWCNCCKSHVRDHPGHPNLCRAKPNPSTDAPGRDIIIKNPVTTGICSFHRVVRAPWTCIDCSDAYYTQ